MTAVGRPFPAMAGAVVLRPQVEEEAGSWWCVCGEARWQADECLVQRAPAVSDFGSGATFPLPGIHPTTKPSGRSRRLHSRFARALQVTAVASNVIQALNSLNRSFFSDPPHAFSSFSASL